MSKDYEYKELESSVSSGGESATLTLVTNMKSGESFLRLEQSYSKRYKTSELEQAKDDMKRLNGSGYIIDIERLVKMRDLEAGTEHLRD